MENCVFGKENSDAEEKRILLKIEIAKLFSGKKSRTTKP